MTVAVTGASGHVGTNLVAALVAAGRPVRAISRREAPHGGQRVEWMRGDVLDPASLRAAFSGCETVFHLAAEISIAGDPAGRVRAINVDGTRNVAEAALVCGVQRLVHCSSVHAFDRARSGPVIDESSPAARSTDLPAYDRSKAAAEQELLALVERGLDAVIVSPTAVIGPADPGPSRMGCVFLRLQRRRVPALVDAGFDWVDVRDVAQALLAAERHGGRGERYLVSGAWLTLRELAEIAASATGVAAPRWTVPVRLARLAAPVASAVVRDPARRRLTSDSIHTLRFSPHVNGEKAIRELGHRPTPLDRTVRDLYEWFSQEARQRA